MEVLPIKGSRFKNWLCKVYYDFTISGDVHQKDGSDDDEEKNQSKVHAVDECFDKEGENDGEKKALHDGADEELDADTLNTENLNNVLRILEAKAVSSKIQRDLHLRVAKETTDDENNVNKGTSILYDLTNEDWQVVRVTASRGWNIEYATVIFRSGLKPKTTGISFEGISTGYI